MQTSRRKRSVEGGCGKMESNVSENLVRKRKIRFNAEVRYQIVLIVLMGVISIMCLFPLIYVVGMSLTSDAELVENNYFVIFPTKPIFSAYKFVLTQDLFLNSFFISVARTICSTVLSSLSCLCVGYVLAEKKLPFRREMMIFIIITMLIGGGLIPAYLWYSDLGLLNSFAILTLPAIINVYSTLVIKVFVEGLPKELLESADMDGASSIKKMIYIVFPLTLPALAATSLFVAVGQWNSWFDAMVYITKDKTLYPMALIVRNLLTSGASEGMGGAVNDPSVQSTPTSIKMASVVISMVPILIVYPMYLVYLLVL